MSAIAREGPVRITRSKIESAWRSRTQKHRLVVSDLDCRGLALVVNPTSMSWRYDYKPRGLDPITGKRFSSRSITIGSPQTHSPDEARAAANIHKGKAKAGTDPAAERRAQINEQAKKRGRTMRRLLGEYSEALPHRSKLRGHGKLSARQIKCEIKHVAAAISSMKAEEKPAEEITTAELKKMLRTASSKPAAARHRYGALSRLFDWALDEGLIRTNPCQLLAKSRRPRSVQPRTTYQTPLQLEELWKAAENAAGLMQVHKDLVRFLIAIPCRRGEAAGMDWRHVNLASATWAQKGQLTKNGDPHRLHLHPLALEILQRRHDAAGQPANGLVFPAPRSGRPIDTFSDMKEAIDAVLPTPVDWRAHDFRRSFVTALGESGVHESIVDSILNHRQSATRSGVLGVYQKAKRWPEQVTVMKMWGNILAAAIDGGMQTKNEVISFERGRA